MFAPEVELLIAVAADVMMAVEPATAAVVASRVLPVKKLEVLNKSAWPPPAYIIYPATLGTVKYPTMPMIRNIK